MSAYAFDAACAMGLLLALCALVVALGWGAMAFLDEVREWRNRRRVRRCPLCRRRCPLCGGRS